MKNNLPKLPVKLLFLLLLASAAGLAQDTIRFRSGEKKVVKVTEVGVDEIKYYNFNHADGPKYTVLKNDIKTIRYQGGLVDSFSVKPAAPPPVRQVMPPYAPLTNQKISYYHGRYYMNGGQPLSRHDMYEMAEELCTTKKVQEICLLLERTRTDYRKKKIFEGIGLGCFGLGGASFLYGISQTNSIISDSYFYAALTGFAFCVGGAVNMGISGSYHRKHKYDLHKLADAYNKY